MKNLPPIHPGEVLLEDFMRPLGLSQYRLAADIGVAALRISQIVRGRRAITADTALRLARYFGTTPGIWLRLQARYDLEVAQQSFGKQIERQVKVRPAPPAGHR
ncbi:MAG: HigA family addiction module antitoxin [Anaerolineales bacterium]